MAGATTAGFHPDYGQNLAEFWLSVAVALAAKIRLDSGSIQSEFGGANCVRLALCNIYKFDILYIVLCIVYV